MPEQEAVLRLGIDSRPAEEGARRVTRSLDDIRSKARGTVSAFDQMAGGGKLAFDRLVEGARRVGSEVSAMGRSLIGAVSVPLLALGFGAVRAATDLDSLRRGLNAITGDAAATERQIASLREIAKLPSVDFKAAAQGSIVFQTLGKDAAFAERMIRGVANAATLSSTGQAGFESVMLQLTQVAGAGKLRGQELSTIIGAAPAMAEAVRRAFGSVSSEEIAKMGLSADQFFERLMRGMESLQQVQGGAASTFENFAGSMNQLGAAIGERILPIIVPLTDRIANLAESLSKADPAAVTLGVSLGAAAIAAGPLVWGVGKLISGMGLALGAFKGLAVFMTGPWGIAAAAVIAGIIAIQQNWFGVGDAARKAWAKIVEITEAVLPALGEATKTWFNVQIGYWVGYARAAGVAFEEVSTLYGEMVDRIQPLTNKLKDWTVTTWNATVTTLNDHLIKPTGEVLGRFFGAGEDAIAQAAASSEASVTRSGARIAQAFLSGFSEDYVGGLGERISGAFTRLRGLLGTAFAGSGDGTDLQGMIDQLTEQLTRPAGNGRTAAQQLADLRELTNYLASVRPASTDVPGSILGEVRDQQATDMARLAMEAYTASLGDARVSMRWVDDTAESFGDAMERVAGTLYNLSDVLDRAGLHRLSDLVGGIGDVVGGAKRIGEGSFQNLGQLLTSGGAFQMLGGALSIGQTLYSGLFGGNPEHEALLARNNESLDRMRASLDHAASTFGRQGDILGAIDPGPGGIFGDMFAMRNLEAAGFSKDQLEALAESLDIELFDERGRLVNGALDDLREAIRLSSLSVQEFGKTLDGAKRLADARRDIFEIDDPVAAATDSLNLLLQGLSERAETQFGLVGLDLNTDSGRAALEEGLRGLFDAFAGGELDPLKDLSGFSSVDEFLSALLGADNALDRMADSANRATNAVTDIPKAVNLALYRSRITGGAAEDETGGGGGGGTGGGGGGPGIILPPTGHPGTNPGGHSGGRELQINTGGAPLFTVVNAAGDSPEDFARKVEAGFKLIAAQGGQVVLQGVTVVGP